MSEVLTSAPSNVPPHMVVEYDLAHGPEVMRYPPASLDEIRKDHPVFWSPYYGGHWVFTGYDDIRAAFQNVDLFRQQEGLPPAPYGIKFKPLRLDPPEHGKYRRLLTPMFAPSRLRNLETQIRQIIRELIAGFAPKGRVDFPHDFSLAVASAMFCGMLDLPLSEFPRFHEMSFGLIYGTSNVWKVEGPEAGMAYRKARTNEIREFLLELSAKRRVSPGSDVMSVLCQGQVDGRPLDQDEIIDTAAFLFFGGTDSTAGSISYAFAYLARHPEVRAKLIANIDDPDYVWNAAEELNRFHGFHHMTRVAAYDAEFAGVQIRKGDLVVLPLGAANRDPNKFADPLSVDLERKEARQHLTFGAGIHRCPGSALATAQLRIALEEIHRAIPDYRIEGDIVMASGGPKIVPYGMTLTFTPIDFVP